MVSISRGLFGHGFSVKKNPLFVVRKIGATHVTSDADANKMKSASSNPTTEETPIAKKKRVSEQEQRTSGDEASAGEETDQEDAEEDGAKHGEDDAE